MLTIQKKLVLAAVVERLAEEGECTRTWLKRYVDFSENQVLAAIEYGLERGVLEAGSKGGYVDAAKPGFSVLEADYYSCIEAMLTKYYGLRVADLGKFMVAKTARKDTKIAGRWTRPDFTVVANRTFPYIRQTEFDIITFEAKRPADCEALAVFEALAHNSAATRSYVFFPITEAELDKNLQGERIREECVRHGIGLFLVKDSFALSEACLLIESQRRPLNPEKCSHFLKQVLETDELGTLTTWPQ